MVGFCWMSMNPCSSLILLMLQKEIRLLLRSIMVSGVWNGFFLDRVRGLFVPCLFCGAPDGDGHLFWECTFPPLVEIRENPEFHDWVCPFLPLVRVRESPEFPSLLACDRRSWPRCFLWHGLASYALWDGASPWAADASEGAGYLVEVALGQYSLRLVAEWSPAEWSPSDELDAVHAASSMPYHRNVWTDGSLVLDRVTGVSSGCVFFFCSPV